MTPLTMINHDYPNDVQRWLGSGDGNYSMLTYTEKRQSRPSFGMRRTTTADLTIRCIWTKSNRLESPEWKRDDSYDQSVCSEDDQLQQLWRDVDKTTTAPIQHDEDCRPYHPCSKWRDRWRLQWIQTLKKSRSQRSNTRGRNDSAKHWISRGRGDKTTTRNGEENDQNENQKRPESMNQSPLNQQWRNDNEVRITAVFGPLDANERKDNVNFSK